MQYRRDRTKGGTFFFTVVTHNRRKILCQPDNIILLRRIFKEMVTRHPFVIDAFVLLPEHLHCIWTLPDGDENFSTRWRLIKGAFTRKCSAKYKANPSLSRKNKNEQSVWQRRFWEHCIRDEDDFDRHVAYIHYNPVKHGLVSSPHEWPYSSFHRYVREGIYQLNWAAEKEIILAPKIGME
ncbi:MAG: transposase [Desulfobulbaceae bacterium]|nr:transposase [Desulfobulbaceae bacterium]